MKPDITPFDLCARGCGSIGNRRQFVRKPTGHDHADLWKEEPICAECQEREKQANAARGIASSATDLVKAIEAGDDLRTRDLTADVEHDLTKLLDSLDGRRPAA